MLFVFVVIKYPKSSNFREERFIWLKVHGPHPVIVGMVWQQDIGQVVRKHLEDWKLSLAAHLRGGPGQVPGAEHTCLWGTSH